ncbi:ABC-2 type transport system permease protein [Actinopolymorpha singaporensis]|uniref:ABC-2 type transport system permease protein n=1 Tax=Actinopolymorpha singaporensis TaxID=117157 RepID=A0A1H1ML85_9ACTN|nr:ABC-2 type transport system permease protein [Actinopolymorpha singaporensis]
MSSLWPVVRPVVQPVVRLVRRPNLRPVLSQVRIGMLTPWAYRTSIMLGYPAVAVQIALYSVVWRAIYAGHDGEVAGADVRTAVGYAVLGLTIAGVLNTSPYHSIASRVREGLIGVDLTRPIGLLTQNLAFQTGAVLAGLPTVAVGLGTGLVVGGLAPPRDPGAAGWFAVSLLLAFAVSQLTTMLMALTSFWTMEVGGINMTFFVVRTFMSGAILPLWFMPGWLQAVAGALPFQASAYTPLAIYFGRPPGGLLPALGVQVLWIVVLGGLCAWVWSRARRRVVVQGG